MLEFRDDINNCFYRCRVPPGAAHLFTLPPIKAKFLGVSQVSGVPVGPEVLVTPALEVLPMGWSWALWLAQSVHESLSDAIGSDASSRFQDRFPCEPLSERNTLHAEYVHNYL